MMKKILPIVIAIFIIAGGTFYCGMKYTEYKKDPRLLFSEERQQFFQENTERNSVREMQRLPDSGFFAGEVINKDEQSLTVKMPNNESRIIFFSSATEISKTAEGSMEDIEIGRQITLNGDKNSDGSYTAKTIQIIK